MRSSRLLQVVLLILALGVGFSLASVSVIQAYAYPYYVWPYYGVSNYCYGYGSNYTYNCPYYTYGYYYPYWGWYYPFYYGYYSYPYSYAYSYYAQPTQFQLTVNVDPPTVQTPLTGAGSYSLGSSASFAATQNIIQVSQDTRYVFSHWSGDYSGQGLSGTVTMNAAKTVTAVYQLQFYLTVNSPSNVPPVKGSDWYNSGDLAALAIPSLIVGGTYSRLVFNGWNVDGTNASTSTSLTVQMNTAHIVTVQYKQQYYLTVASDQGSTSGTGWYDAGTQAQISASTPPSPAYGINMLFNGWTGPVSSPSSQSTTVLMDAPKTVTATWRADATVLYATMVTVIAVIAVSIYLLATRRKEKQAIVTHPADTPKMDAPGNGL